MTIYILHGGETKKACVSNDAFFQLMADYVSDGGVWLGCYFASDADREDTKFRLDSERVQQAGGDRFRTMMATTKDFSEQVKMADVVYFAGGMTKKLINQISVWPELPTWLKGCKVVVGSSAGMNMLGLSYVSKDGSYGKGVGLVPFNMLVHHRAADYKTTHEALPLEAPLLALHETQFCVIEL